MNSFGQSLLDHVDFVNQSGVLLEHRICVMYFNSGINPETITCPSLLFTPQNHNRRRELDMNQSEYRTEPTVLPVHLTLSDLFHLVYARRLIS